MTDYMELCATRRAEMTFEERVQSDNAYNEADIASNLAQVVYDLRVGAGLSKKELAHRMGTTKGMVSRLDAGFYAPTTELMASLLTAVGHESMWTCETCGHTKGT